MYQKSMCIFADIFQKRLDYKKFFFADLFPIVFMHLTFMSLLRVGKKANHVCLLVYGSFMLLILSKFKWIN